MIIPKKVKVGNITYKVQLKDLKNKNLGLHRVNRKSGSVIQLEKDLPEELMENVFYHELTHAILFQVGLVDDSEMVTQSLANVLQNLFKLK